MNNPGNFGQDMLRKAQQQMQQQMQQQLQRNMQMHWWSILQRKKREKQEPLDKSSRPQWRQPGSAFQMDKRFARVEAEVAELNQKLAAGNLTSEQFHEKMRELMIQDDSGGWWMLGSDSGAWYYFNGSDWVQSSPPGAKATNQIGETGHRPQPNIRHQFLAVLVLLLGLPLVAALGFGAANLIGGVLRIHGGPIPLIGALVVWLFGVVFVFSRVRNLWKGN